jgi:hypothetical protein
MSSLDAVEIYRSDCTSPLCRIRIAETSNALKGELDVFIQAASGKFFERITVQRPDRFIDYTKHPGEINACTWHSNYLLSDGKIVEPKIHLKSGSKKLAWTALEDVIDQEKIFMFPVFSLYIPASFSASKKKAKGTVQKLFLKQRDCRIDFFLLPRNVPRDKFERLTVYNLFLHYDITIFNRQFRCALLPLDNCEVEFNWQNLMSWWSLIRVVYPKLVKITQYWIYFHDTFDILSCILDRGYAFPASNLHDSYQEIEHQEKLLLRDLHEKELLELGLRRTKVDLST